MTFTREQVSFMQERIQAWCRNSPHTITNGDVIVLLTDARFEVEKKPKYDPTRLFKKGDRVRVVERYGRKFWSAAPEKIYTVVADEYLCDDQNVLLRGCVSLNDGKPETLLSWNVPFFHVELVFPVEELEPYFVMELKGAYGVYNTRFQPETEACHFFTDMHPNAKEAAEAECARLNAEYRKEQK